MEPDIKKAPKGQYRVIGRDNPRDQGWKQGDYSTLSEAKKALIRIEGTVRFRVYNDQGKCVHGNNDRLEL